MLHTAAFCNTSPIALFERLTGENTMSTSFKTLLATSATAFLAACGGGADGALPATFNQPAWASPAMYVPVGSSQVNVVVSDCTTNNNASLAMLSPQRTRLAGTAISTPTLVITSAGDVIFSGAVGATATVSELVRVNFSDTTQRNIRFDANSSLNTFYAEAVDDISLNISGRTIQLNAYNDTRDESYDCTTVTAPAAQVPPSEARLLAVFLPGIVGTVGNATNGSPTLSSNNTAIWDNLQTMLTLPLNQASARYAGLNLTTGALTVGPSSGAVTSSVALSIAGATGGYYAEEFSSGNVDTNRKVDFQVQTADRGLLRFLAETRRDLLQPIPSLGSLSSPVLLP
jgi:hypothetical protein